MVSFKTIRARAAKRKGGDAALAALLPKVVGQKALAKLSDDRVLAEMAKRVFSAGFVWSVIEKKWPGFEAAFLKFEPRRLLHPARRVLGEAGRRQAHRAQSAEDHGRARQRAVRRRHRRASTAASASFSAQWPADDQIGLLELLAKRGARLGGRTGQYFLRFIGKDGFVTSTDVVACLRDAGLDIAENPTSKKDLRKIQDQFNAWAKETGLPLHPPLAHLRHVDRRELRRRDTAQPGRDG